MIKNNTIIKCLSDGYQALKYNVKIIRHITKEKYRHIVCSGCVIQLDLFLKPLESRKIGLLDCPREEKNKNYYDLMILDFRTNSILLKKFFELKRLNSNTW
jgi:hypothetical protein